MDVNADGAGPHRQSPGQLRRAARVALAVAVAVAVFGFALPRFASATEVWHAIGHVGWRGAALLAISAGWNLVTYWLVWMAAVPNLGLRRAALVSQAPTAVANTVPAGSYVAVALTYSMLRSWGLRRSSATLAMVVTGIWNNFAKLALPVVALAALAIGGDIDAPRVVGRHAGRPRVAVPGAPGLAARHRRLGGGGRAAGVPGAHLPAPGPARRRRLCPLASHRAARRRTPRGLGGSRCFQGRGDR